LTLQELQLGDAVMLALRAPGGMNRMIRESARHKAKTPPERLVAELRASVGSRRHNVGVSENETLIDILVHSQDIADPLGRRLPLNPRAPRVAAERVRSKGWPFYPRRRFAGLTLAATGIPWTLGTGGVAPL
jgi:hypothetical protein